MVWLVEDVLLVVGVVVACPLVYCLYDLSVYFLRRLQINNDSHEFILEFCTVANTTKQSPLKLSPVIPPHNILSSF